MTTKNSHSTILNESTVSLTDLENAFNRPLSVRFPGADNFSPYRADFKRAVSEYNLGHFEEAKSILSMLTMGLEPALASQRKKSDATQVHLLYASTLALLGRTCERLKQEKESMSAFREAKTEFQKWLPEAKEPTGQMYLDYGVALFKMESKRAIEAFTEAAKRGTLNAEGNRYMGICLERLGKLKEAEECFSEAIRQDPDQYRTHQALAKLLEREKKISDAVKEYHITILQMLDSGAVDDALLIVEHVLKLTKQEPQILALKGEVLRRQGDLKGALETLDRSLKRQPRNAFASGVKGLVLLGLGQDENGVRHLEQACKLDPAIDWVPVELALALKNSERYENALSALNKALDSNPRNVNALLQKSDILSELGRNEEALLAIDKALKLQPDDAFLLGRKGQVLRHLNQHKKALKVLQQSVALNPRIAWVRGELGAVLYGMGDYYDALLAVIDALAIQPDNVFALSYKSEILRTLGMIEGSVDRTEEALQVINQALALSSKDAWALGTKGQVLRDLGRVADAIEILQQSIELHPTLAWVYLELSAAQYSVGNYTAALEALDKALELEDDSEWHVFKAQILCEMARFEESVTALDHAIQLNKKTPVAFGLKGWALQHLGVEQAANALRAYESAVKLDPDNLWWHKGIANGLYLMGNKSEASKKYKWVLKQAEKRQAEDKEADTNFLSLIGWCHYRLGHGERAVEIFKHVLSINPEQIATQFDLALALTSCGQYYEALYEYNRGIQLCKGQPKSRGHALIFVALDDLKIAITQQPELVENEKVKTAVTLLEAADAESQKNG